MLVCIVRSPAVDENGRSGVAQVTRDRVADSRATAGTGDEGVTAGQLHGGPLLSQVGG
jgi:hypothetical protein